jgi:hypothetical protein
VIYQFDKKRFYMYGLEKLKRVRFHPVGTAATFVQEIRSVKRNAVKLRRNTWQGG